VVEVGKKGVDSCTSRVGNQGSQPQRKQDVDYLLNINRNIKLSRSINSAGRGEKARGGGREGGKTRLRRRTEILNTVIIDVGKSEQIPSIYTQG